MRIPTTTVNVRKLWRAGCAMALLCIQTNVSLAAPLAPGGSIAAPPELDPVGGSLLDTISSPFATASFTGTLISSVYSGDTSNPFGLPDLTFTYELIMGSGPDSASAVSIGSFAGFQTDVSYQVPSIGLAPGTISRNPSGSQAVKFDFSGVGFPQYCRAHSSFGAGTGERRTGRAGSRCLGRISTLEVRQEQHNRQRIMKKTRAA
jgi:hypothetical protein